MQLAVDVQIPEEFGGVEGEAVYIGIFCSSKIQNVKVARLLDSLVGHAY